MYNQTRNGQKKIGGRWRFLAVAVDPPPFLHSYILSIPFNLDHTKGEPLNSLMKAADPTYRQVLKTPASATSLLSHNSSNFYLIFQR